MDRPPTLPDPHEVNALLLDAASVGLAVMGEDLRLLSANRAFLELAACTASAVGQPIGEVLGWLGPKVPLVLGVTLQTGSPIENVILEGLPPAQTTPCTLLLGARQVLVDQGRARAVALQLSRVARTEPAGDRRDRLRLFETLFENAAVGVIAFPFSGEQPFTNRAVRRMLGYDQEEIFRLGIEQVTHPGDFAKDAELFRQLMAGEIDHYQVTKRYLQKGGAVIWGELMVSIARLPSGEPELVISLLQDVTEKHVVAVERDRLIEDLARAVRAREIFLAIAAHEIRTPLTPLRVILDLLRERLSTGAAGPPDPESLMHLDRATRSTQRLSALVETLLDVSRLATGRLELARAVLDLSALTQEVADRFRAEAQRARCSLTVVTSGPVPISADRIRLEQVLLNLLSNAVKFGAGKPVSVRVERVDGRARLQVIDQGPGIAAEDQARIFGRFERAAAELSYGGLGLGLFIARQIALAHEGTITVQSQAGAGATFTVDLPALVPGRP